MTLIISVMRDDLVVQVSDRRLTHPDGSMFDDEANKVVCVACRDAKFLIAYTGLAFIAGKRTDVWIADYLTSTGAGNKSFPELFQDFREAASVTFRSAGAHRRITFAIVGFGPRGPFAAHVSNFEDQNGGVLEEIDDAFQWVVSLRNKEALRRLAFCVYGLDKTITNFISDRSLSIIRKKFLDARPEKIVSLLVQIIRQATKHPTLGRLIGESCMSVVTDPGGPFMAQYHPRGDTTMSYTPHIVTASFSATNIWVRGIPT